MDRLENIKSKLQASGMRITKPRLAVAKILIEHAGCPLSPEEIHQKTLSLKGISCDQVSVYRALSKFKDLGLATKSSFQGEAARYKLAGLNPPRHEHFFKCRQCQNVESFNECFVSKKERLLEAAGYKNVSHHLEISGVCPKCVNS